MKRSLLFFVYLFILSAILPNFADVDAQLINEFSSAAGSTSDSDYPDWVEVYFEEGQDKSLYQLTDGNGNMKNLSEAVCNVNICTVDWSNRLDNEGDQIKLELIKRDILFIYGLQKLANYLKTIRDIKIYGDD